MVTGTRKARSHGRSGAVAAWLVLVLVGLSAAGCDRDPTGRDGGLSAREFVQIVVELRTAAQEVEREVVADSVEVEYERRKAVILERHDASEADLHAFLEEHHARPGLMSAVWDSIAQRLRAPPEEVDEMPHLDDGW